MSVLVYSLLQLHWLSAFVTFGSLLVLFLPFHQSGLQVLKGSVTAMRTFSTRFGRKTKVLNQLNFLQVLQELVAMWRKINIIVPNEQKAVNTWELHVGFDIRSSLCNI